MKTYIKYYQYKIALTTRDVKVENHNFIKIFFEFFLEFLVSKCNI